MNDKKKAYNKKYRQDNPDKIDNLKRVWNLKTKYNMTLEEYVLLEEKQNHSCAICKTNTPGGKGRWHIDHCHVTKKVRGLLCYRCNSILGYIKDDKNVLLKAIEYLNDSQSSTANVCSTQVTLHIGDI